MAVTRCMGRLYFYAVLFQLLRHKIFDFMGALCLTVPKFIFRVIFILAYTNPHKKSHPTKKALTVPKPDYPVLLRHKDRIKTYSATNGPGSDLNIP